MKVDYKYTYNCPIGRLIAFRTKSNLFAFFFYDETRLTEEESPEEYFYRSDDTSWGFYQSEAISLILKEIIIPYWTRPDDTKPEPKNNDGREACFWCNQKTETKFGFYFTTAWNVCPKCKK